MLNQAIKYIKTLRNTSSTNDKIGILHDWNNTWNDDTLQKLLEYTYNPFKKYGFGSVLSTEPYHNPQPFDQDEMFELLDTLINSNINDSLRADVIHFRGRNMPEEYRDIFECILTKDLLIGMGAKSINKVFPGLIPIFDLQLAESYFKQKEGCLTGRSFALTKKLDGMRMVAIKRGNKVKFYSRQGQEIDGVEYLENEILGIEINGCTDFVLDGELLLDNVDNLPSDDLYRATMRVARKKGEKPGLQFHMFDVLPAVEFAQGKSVATYSVRRNVLDSIFDTYSFKHLINVPVLYSGADEQQIFTWLDWAKENDQEGVMLNFLGEVYECKRSKNILKIKAFHDADVRVMGVVEGTKRNKGKLGAIKIQFIHEDKLHTCECGSGFSDYERQLYWSNPELLLGKIVTIKYFEVSKNKQGGFGLRFPTWNQRIRDDKDEISMY